MFERIEHLTEDLARKALAEPAAIEASPGMTTQSASSFGRLPVTRTSFSSSARVADARVGAARGRAALDDGFFRARWDRATKAEQRYLRTMAADADAGSSSGDVAARLGRRVTSFGPVRASLIAKGLIFAREHGVVAFTVSGMANFIQRQPQP